ncbi:MAG: hypothetical protein WC284_16320, partial [Candidimonas sp.]
MFEYLGYMYTASSDWAATARTESPVALAALQQTGANTIIHTLNIHQESLTSSVVGQHYWDAGYQSLSDDSIRTVIRDAHAFEQEIFLKPLVYIGDKEAADSFKWSIIEPSDPAQWFSTYKAEVLRVATIAQQEGAKGIFLGNELESMTTNPDYLHYWTDIIESVRSVYGGLVSYNALASRFDEQSGDNPSEFMRVTFWDQLDFIGLSMYPRLSDKQGGTTVDEFMQGWFQDAQGQNPIETMKAIADQYGKQIVISELGDDPWAGNNRWHETDKNLIDLVEQQNFFEAAFRVLAEHGGEWLKGVFPYNWVSAYAAWQRGESWATDTTQGTWEWSLYDKPAGDTIAAWYTDQPQYDATPKIGTSAADALDGGWFHDHLTGGVGNDTLRGFAGNDTLIGGGGNDSILGSDGHDFIDLRGGG